MSMLNSATPLEKGRAHASSSKSSKLVLPKRDLASFLGDFPDHRALSDLLLPGTHDCLAYYGYPFSQCQSPRFPLEAQLNNGVRVVDIRLAVIGAETLIAYHGIISQRVAFTTVLTVIKRFLKRCPTECLVMSIKQEDYTPATIFSRLVKEVVYADRDLWFLEDRIPTLGEARGKIVMFSRFNDSGANWPNGDRGLGIHPTTWPDSHKGTFSWYCSGTKVAMQDWYAIPSFLSIPEKFSIAVAPLVQTRDASNDPRNFSEKSNGGWPFPKPQPPLAVSFTSAASVPLALPPMVALGFGIASMRRYWWGRVLGWAGMNERLRNWLKEYLESVLQAEDQQALLVDEKRLLRDEEKAYAYGTVKVRGWVLIDYVDTPDDLLPLLIECNYH